LKDRCINVWVLFGIETHRLIGFESKGNDAGTLANLTEQINHFKG
jgi:hypothetical protein